MPRTYKKRERKAKPEPLTMTHRTLCTLAGIDVRTWVNQVRKGTAPPPVAYSGTLMLYPRKAVNAWLSGKGWPPGMWTKAEGTGTGGE